MYRQTQKTDIQRDNEIERQSDRQPYIETDRQDHKGTATWTNGSVYLIAIGGKRDRQIEEQTYID